MIGKWKWTVIAALVAVMTLDSCGTVKNTIPAGQLYNHWIAYCYVLPGQMINSRFDITGPISNSSFKVTPESPVNLNDFSVRENKTDPWNEIDVQWSPKNTGVVDLVPLSLSLSNGKKNINLILGEWHIDVLHALLNYPINIDSQTVGDTLTEMQSSYPFSIKLTSNQPIDMKTLSVESNAPDKFLNIKISKITQNNHDIDIEGTMLF